MAHPHWCKCRMCLPDCESCPETTCFTSCFNLGDPLTPEEQIAVEATMPEVKDTNPKDAVGIKKAPISTVSGAVMAELGLAMMEGARKYGRHNYRVSGVRASVYRDATWRHLNKWWEGEDIDPDSGLNHVTKAIASLMVLRDAMIFDKLLDDRPPPVPSGFFKEMDKLAADIIDRYPDCKEPYLKVHERDGCRRHDP